MADAVLCKCIIALMMMQKCPDHRELTSRMIAGVCRYPGRLRQLGTSIYQRSSEYAGRLVTRT